MNKPTMKEILSNTPQFSSRAAYFSGRGAILCDLDSKRLFHIQEQILKHYGDDASKAFVKMVDSMDNMNATDFINNCYSLEGNGFKLETEARSKNGIEIEKNSEGEYDMVHGMLSIMSALSSNRDETAQIKGQFLRANGIRPVGKFKDERWYQY